MIIDIFIYVLFWMKQNTQIWSLFFISFFFVSRFFCFNFWQFHPIYFDHMIILFCFPKLLQDSPTSLPTPLNSILPSLLFCNMVARLQIYQASWNYVKNFCFFNCNDYRGTYMHCFEDCRLHCLWKYIFMVGGILELNWM